MWYNGLNLMFHLPLFYLTAIQHCEIPQTLFAVSFRTDFTKPFLIITKDFSPTQAPSLPVCNCFPGLSISSLGFLVVISLLCEKWPFVHIFFSLSHYQILNARMTSLPCHDDYICLWELTENTKRSNGAAAVSENWGFRLQKQSIWVSWRDIELLKVTKKQLQKY